MIAQWIFEGQKDRIKVRECIRGNEYRINDEESNQFVNRKLRCIDGISGQALLFDGYSVYAEGDLDLGEEIQEMTLSVWVLPRSYELKTSGIISQCDMKQKRGFVLGIGQYGKFVFGLGDGENWHEVSSLQHTMDIGQWSYITVVFEGKAGWMKLYHNGIEINRKQMPRYTTLKKADVKCLLGKHNDGEMIADIFPFNVFDGCLSDITILDKTCTKEDVTTMYSKALEPYDGHIPYVPKDKISLRYSDYKQDLQRPQYHLIPPGHWMNEPHAPIYFEGKYHIFYQANPHAPIWNNIQWGHMISEDMVHWRDLGLALECDAHGLDSDGCWSGSCCYDEKGIPAIFYTAGNNSRFPNQFVALATTPYLSTGDTDLIKWEKYTQPLVEQAQEIGWTGEFRDPYVWKEEHAWYMLVGTGDRNNGGGNAALYTSEDMYHWTYRNMIMDYTYEECTEVGHVWELPVLLPLRNTKGIIEKHILLLCACQIEGEIVETYYWTGKWDKENYKFLPEHTLPKLLDLGKGTFTGPSGFVTPDKRSVVFTIAQGKRTLQDECEAGWAHNGGLPIELGLDDIGEVTIKPIKELEKLRVKKLLDKKYETIQSVNESLEHIEGNMFEVKMSMRGDSIGIGIQHNSDEMINISYDKMSQIYKAVNGKKEISRLRGEIDLVECGEEILNIHLYLDHSMIEAYLNNKKGMTLRNYTTEDKRKIKILGEIDRQVERLEVWELRGVYN